MKVAEEVRKEERREITMSTGVVLRGKQVPPLILVRIMGRFPRPKVPTYLNKAMGREMENPDDPDYLSRVQAWQVELSDAVLNAMIMLGTEAVSWPKGMSGPWDDDWLTSYAMLGLDMFPENRDWRYVTWIMFRAIADENDTKKIREVVGRLSGVPEASVQSAEDFPGSQQTDR